MDTKKRVYDVLVRYRTRSGTNAAYHMVWASDSREALKVASEARRARRGVVRIDSCQAKELFRTR